VNRYLWDSDICHSRTRVIDEDLEAQALVIHKILELLHFLMERSVGIAFDCGCVRIEDDAIEPECLETSERKRVITFGCETIESIELRIVDADDFKIFGDEIRNECANTVQIGMLKILLTALHRHLRNIIVVRNRELLERITRYFAVRIFKDISRHFKLPEAVAE